MAIDSKLVHPDIPLADVTGVTHFLCPKGPTRDGAPEATHHLVPKRSGVVAGWPAWQQVCSYCERTEKDLRAELLDS